MRLGEDKAVGLCRDRRLNLRANGRDLLKWRAQRRPSKEFFEEIDAASFGATDPLQVVEAGGVALVAADNADEMVEEDPHPGVPGFRIGRDPDDPLADFRISNVHGGIACPLLRQHRR